MLLKKDKKVVIKSSKNADRSFPGTIFSRGGNLHISSFVDLPQATKDKLFAKLAQTGFRCLPTHIIDGDLVIPQYSKPSTEHPRGMNRASIVGHVIGSDNIQVGKHKKLIRRVKHNSEPLDFEAIQIEAKKFAEFLDLHREEIAESLSDYECYNVAMDEIDRSVDVLTNLHKNADYFVGRAGNISTFLPINQPLYASVCFGVVPVLMASGADLRVPTDMQVFFRRLDSVVKFSTFFPRLHISYDSREEFIERRKAITETVIFTGRPENGILIKKQFKPDVLFIINGAGHNPIVVSDNADIEKTVASILRVCLQNQGQDCAAPNAILVKQSQLEAVKTRLLEKLEEVKNCIGPCNDKKNIIGPNTRPEHVLKIATLLHKNKQYCIFGGGVNVVTGIIDPCVIEKPLNQGPNLEEFFAPFVMLQPYNEDHELSAYFEHTNYKPNAMYVTVFGESAYVETLIGKGLHTPDNIIRNTDLHYAERGFLPYGGTGWAASSIHVNGTVICGATLPQRDIFLYNVQTSTCTAVEGGDELDTKTPKTPVGINERFFSSKLGKLSGSSRVTGPPLTNSSSHIAYNSQ